MSAYIEFAKREFAALGYPPIEECEDGPDKWIQENVLELLRVFSEQGHSGGSAPYCASMFSKLALFEPLSPLVGDDSEWTPVGDGLYQNNRCSRVFKDANLFDGKPYDIDAIVFRYPDGIAVTNATSRVVVDFPYMPSTRYVDVDDGGAVLDWGLAEKSTLLDPDFGVPASPPDTECP